MNEENIATCETCKHFRQHYIKFGRGYSFVYCGHCVYPMLKARKPGTNACKYFKERTENIK